QLTCQDQSGIKSPKLRCTVLGPGPSPVSLTATLIFASGSQADITSNTISVTTQRTDASLEWTEIPETTFGTNIDSIAYGNGTFVAASYGSMKGAYSLDGVTWTAIDNMGMGTSRIRSIAYGNGRFVAVGDGGKGSVSMDGLAWNAIGNMTFGNGGVAIASVVFGNGRFVAVGTGGKGAYSADGITWTAVPNMQFGTDTIVDVTYGAGKFLAVGWGGKGAYSADGITWTAVPNMQCGTSVISSVAYGNGRFVAVNAAGKGVSSPDGVTWTAVDDMGMESRTARSIAFGDGRFVAVGDSGKGSVSMDGLAWKTIADMKFGQSPIASIAFGDGRFVAVGDGGKGSYAGIYAPSESPDSSSSSSSSASSLSSSASSSLHSSSSSTAVCTDSDGGLVYDVQGTITNYLPYGTEVFPSATDICFKDNNQNPAIDPNILLEGYCGDDGYGRLEQYTCPNGCEDGVCLPPGVSSSSSSSPSSSSSSSHSITSSSSSSSSSRLLLPSWGCSPCSAQGCGYCTALGQQCVVSSGLRNGYQCQTTPEPGWIACGCQSATPIDDCWEDTWVNAGGKPCCPGLSELPNMRVIGGSCVRATATFCTACGDGVCNGNDNGGENFCNCPEDCGTTPASSSSSSSLHGAGASSSASSSDAGGPEAVGQEEVAFARQYAAAFGDRSSLLASANGRFIVYARRPSSWANELLYLLDTQELVRQEIPATLASYRSFAQPHLSADGRFVGVQEYTFYAQTGADELSSLWIYDTATGERTVITAAPAPGSTGKQATFARNMQSAAFFSQWVLDSSGQWSPGNGDVSLYLWREEDGIVQLPVMPENAGGDALRFLEYANDPGRFLFFYLAPFTSAGQYKLYDLLTGQLYTVSGLSDAYAKVSTIVSGGSSSSSSSACPDPTPPACEGGVLFPQPGPDENGCTLAPVCCEGAQAGGECTTDMSCTNGFCVVDSCTCE
ncbi:MAG: hypothetical protein PHX93_00930, partial [Candidatus Peribacteraceae bacterium]|nr:hypothetical protein [Candidatus Peribacteraceae bacterium]